MAPPAFEREDEQKVMLQFPDEVSAVAAFLHHFDDPRFFGGVQAMPVAEFRRKVRVADGVMVKSCPAVVFRKSTRLEPRLRRDGVRQRYVVRVDAGHPEAGGGASHAEFVHAPGGGIDFGEITSAMAIAMKRQPGKIRLPRGVQNADGTGYGLAHIEANHGKHIRGAGFASVELFVSHVAKDFCQVWQATGRQLLVAVRDGKQHMMYVQLEPADEGDYYRVNSAFPVRQGDYPEKHGFKPLWDGSEPASTASGKRPAFASGASCSGGADPNARGNGSTTTIPNPGEESTHKSLPTGGAFNQEQHMEKIGLLKSHIDAYVRNDGTQVKAHDDKRIKKIDKNSKHYRDGFSSGKSGSTDVEKAKKHAKTEAHPDDIHVAEYWQGALDGHHARAASNDGDGLSGDVSLDHPAYNTPVKLGGYNGKTTVHQANSSRDAANVLIRNNPGWSKADHAKLAAAHQKAADAHHEAWDKRVDQAHQETFGKPFGIGDYKVSGIARDEYSEEHKTALRTHAHSETKHDRLAAAHAAASTSRLVKS